VRATIQYLALKSILYLNALAGSIYFELFVKSWGTHTYNRSDNPIWKRLLSGSLPGNSSLFSASLIPRHLACGGGNNRKRARSTQGRKGAKARLAANTPAPRSPFERGLTLVHALPPPTFSCSWSAMIAVDAELVACLHILGILQANCHSLNSTSTQVESDKVLSRTTHHHPLHT
jgi:hypothetical protein